MTISLRIVCSGRVPESRTQETNPGAGCFIVCVSEVLCGWAKGDYIFQNKHNLILIVNIIP